jgi:predicted PurR-regulated permease PerM
VFGENPPGWVRRAVLWFWGAAIALWVALELVEQLRTLVIVLIVSLFLALALEPWVDRLERVGVRRGIGTALVFGGLLIATGVFVGSMGALLATQINELITKLPERIESTRVWLDEQFNIQVDTDELVRQFQADGRAARWATTVAQNLLDFGAAALGVVFQGLAVVLFTFYLTADGPRLRRSICSVLPQDRQREVLRVWELATDKTGAYLASRVILAVVAATFHWVAFSLLGLPSAVAMAVWVGVLSQFVPVIGTYLAGILPLVVALGDRPVLALWVLGVIVVYQQLENYVLLPRITASTLAIHPAVAFGAVIVGASLLGAIGAVLALPAAATVVAFISAYVARHEVVESRLLGDAPEPGAAPPGAPEPEPAPPATPGAVPTEPSPAPGARPSPAPGAVPTEPSPAPGAPRAEPSPAPASPPAAPGARS